MSIITLIAALDRQRCIGVRNDLPWHIPEDFAFFKQYTLGKPVLMGRKTWDSLPRKPLPGRRNVVISRQPHWQADGAEHAASLEDALARVAGAPEIVVIGGAEIYRQALPLATDLRLTEVALTVENGDAFFPPVDPAEWQPVARQPGFSPQQNIAFDWVHYRRRATANPAPSA